MVAIISFLTFQQAVAGPLHEAAIEGSLEEINRLLDDGIDVNTQDVYYAGSTPLYEAATQGQLSAVDPEQAFSACSYQIR